MPNFNIHRKYNYIILIIIILSYLYYETQGNFDIRKISIVIDLYYRQILIFIIAYFLGTELFTPDLDTNSIPYQRLRFLYFPLKWYLMPHRSKSHQYIHGPTAQVIYLGLIAGTIFFIINRLGQDFNLITEYFNIGDIVTFSIGIYISNWTHITIDNIYHILGWNCN